MATTVSFALRRTASALRSSSCNPSTPTSARYLSTGNPFSIDVDHYTSGWDISDIDEFNTAGKYRIQTFNKISTKVRTTK